MIISYRKCSFPHRRVVIADFVRKEALSILPTDYLLRRSRCLMIRVMQSVQKRKVLFNQTLSKIPVPLRDEIIQKNGPKRHVFSLYNNWIRIRLGISRVEVVCTSSFSIRLKRNPAIYFRQTSLVLIPVSPYNAHTRKRISF